MPHDEHPDRAWERHQALADEDLARERHADRLGDYTPAPAGSPPITSAMTTLAWTVLNGSDHDRRDAARVLAELVLEAAA